MRTLIANGLGVTADGSTAADVLVHGETIAAIGADLADAGVDQFNVFLMNGDEEGTLEVYGREIIPALRS